MLGLVRQQRLNSESSFCLWFLNHQSRVSVGFIQSIISSDATPLKHFTINVSAQILHKAAINPRELKKTERLKSRLRTLLIDF